MFDLNQYIRVLLEKYQEKFPDEYARHSLLSHQLEENDDLSTRKNFTGHVTASALILSHDQKTVAFIENKNLGAWLAPGGHWEKGDDAIYSTARREALEETGISMLRLHDWHREHSYIPLHIDSHTIPENPRKEEKEHTHHDFLYVFLSGDEDKTVRLNQEEVRGFRWLTHEEIQNHHKYADVWEKIGRLGLL